MQSNTVKNALLHAAFSAILLVGLCIAEEDVTWRIPLISLLGLDKIEYLQEHQNKHIYKRASGIIENYFSDVDDFGVDSMVMPDSTSAGYNFGAGAAAAPENGFSLWENEMRRLEK